MLSGFGNRELGKVKMKSCERQNVHNHKSGGFRPKFGAHSLGRVWEGVSTHT